jgi:hypothetical protein
MRRGTGPTAARKAPAAANKVPHSVIEAVVREALCAKSQEKRDTKESDKRDDDESSSSDLEKDDKTDSGGHQSTRMKSKAGLAQDDDAHMPEQGSEFKEIARLRRTLQASSARERVLVRENASLQVRYMAACCYTHALGGPMPEPPLLHRRPSHSECFFLCEKSLACTMLVHVHSRMHVQHKATLGVTLWFEPGLTKRMLHMQAESGNLYEKQAVYFVFVTILYMTV